MKEVHKNIAILGRSIAEILAEAYNAPLNDDIHVIVDRMIVPKGWWTIIRKYPTLFNIVTQKAILQEGLIAFLWGANIYADAAAKKKLDSATFELYTDEEEGKGVKYIFHMKPFV